MPEIAFDEQLDDFRAEFDSRFADLRAMVKDDGEAALYDHERDFYRLYLLLQRAEEKLAQALGGDR